MKREKCMICHSARLYEFIDFGLQPNGNNFLPPEEIANEQRLPMAMMLCEDCGLVQMSDLPTAEFLFADHPYLTGVSKPYVEHFERLVPRVIKKLGLQPNALVVDIGCNDGTLPEIFRRSGMRVLGVDPGRRTTEVARKNGITVCEVFWTAATGAAFGALNLKPDLITSTASFYHMPDINDYVSGLRAAMGPETVFMAQCVYLKDVVTNGQVDQFYHEHSCLHAIRPLKALFARHGMRILDFEHIDVQGGSFLVFVGLDSHPMPTSPAVDEAIRAELACGLDQRSTYDHLAERFRTNATELRALLSKLKGEGKTIHAIGASLRGMSLLNYFGISLDHIDCILEVNQFKIGKVAPGSHIPVVDERTMGKWPDCFLMLSWTFADYLIDKYAEFLAAGGMIIIPVPTLRVITATDLKK